MADFIIFGAGFVVGLLVGVCWIARLVNRELARADRHGPFSGSVPHG